MRPTRLALLVLASYGLVALCAGPSGHLAAAPAAQSATPLPHPPAEEPSPGVKRRIGRGQIKFCARGLCAGPERWALRSLQHARDAAALRRRLERMRAQLRHLRAARTLQAHEAAPVVAHYEAWLCIHSHEGAWDANTGNGYYGGLQMDYGFMQSYGPELLAAKGTADNWTPLEQMVVAERAYASRGFSPWPNTARMCGLL